MESYFRGVRIFCTVEYCCNLERIRNTLEFTYIDIYRYIYIENAASALYNESKQTGTGSAQRT